MWLSKPLHLDRFPALICLAFSHPTCDQHVHPISSVIEHILPHLYPVHFISRTNARCIKVGLHILINVVVHSSEVLIARDPNWTAARRDLNRTLPARSASSERLRQ